MTERIESPDIDRSKWEPGPWDNEPDRVDFEHAGFACMILRNRIGALCGYVGIPEEHPLFGVEYGEPCDALKALLGKRMDQPLGETPGMGVMLACLSGEAAPRPDVALSVHGGITYSAECSGKICHVPRPGMPTRVWWYGFDCGHAGDLYPSMGAVFGAHGIQNDGVYRDVEYVRAECQRLAEQLRDVERVA